MYGSWRSRDAISYSSSRDGFVWNQNLLVSLPGDTESKWEPIVNRPFVLKRATGDYLMWYLSFLLPQVALICVSRYTGQVQGEKMGGKIGVATSTNGVQFARVQGKLEV